jgi:hypothetical protein
MYRFTVLNNFGLALAGAGLAALGVMPNFWNNPCNGFVRAGALNCPGSCGTGNDCKPKAYTIFGTAAHACNCDQSTAQPTCCFIYLPDASSTPDATCNCKDQDASCPVGHNCRVVSAGADNVAECGPN